MIVTSDKLQYENARPEDAELFQKLYPHGAAWKDVIENQQFSNDFILWGYDHLGFDLNKEVRAIETAAYNARFGVVNSELVYKSSNIKGSKYISQSTLVTNSTQILQSRNITNSFNVAYSEQVVDCRNISNCKFINNSDNVYKSNYIFTSSVVANSSTLKESKNIYCSTNLINCNTIYNSTNLKNSVMSTECHNGNHLMFCFGLHDKEYHIFNQPIQPELYDLLFPQFEALDWPAANFVEHLSDNLLFYTATPRTNITQFLTFTTGQVDFIKSLPFYSADLLQKLVYRFKI